ncbi:MAG: hypothetical protein ACOYIP_06460 [Coriobacteriales bacterium]|jgi:hypothetical protein
MDENDFTRERLRQNVRLYRGLRIVTLVVAACAAIAAIVAFARGIIAGGFVMLGGAAFFLFDSFLMRGTAQDNQTALDEIGDDPTDIDLRDDLSPKTEALIGESMLRIKDYLGQTISYAIIGIVMILGAMVICAVSTSIPVLFALGVALGLGGLLLIRLAVVAARNRKTAKLLLEMEEREDAALFGDE